MLEEENDAIETINTYDTHKLESETGESNQYLEHIQSCKHSNTTYDPKLTKIIYDKYYGISQAKKKRRRSKNKTSNKKINKG